VSDWVEVLAGALEELDVPAVVVDGQGRTRAANAAARRAEGDDVEALAAGPQAASAIVVQAGSAAEWMHRPDEHAESRRQLNEAQAVAQVGSWSADPATGRVTFSDEEYRLYGLEPVGAGPVDLRQFLSLIHPDDRRAIRDAVDRCFATGEPFNVLHRLITPDGATRWLEGRGRAFVVGGRTVRMVGTSRDVTEREAYEASLRATLEDVRASRARIVEAADAERRRVERDLHDGAQQRLVAMSMGLRLAQALAAERGDDELTSLLDATADELRGALGDLRDLARGIHPAMLTEEGLTPALESLALRSVLPAQVLACPARRLPEPVEVGLFYIVSEALTNAARHSGGTLVTVEVSDGDGGVRAVVRDDGAGGARVDAGTGLLGLQDRAAALGGTLTLDSPPGGGTTITVEVPCG
jgi:PAS domain S-box-containing protein